MSDGDLIDELMIRWEAARAQGWDPGPEELCAAHPRLTNAVRHPVPCARDGRIAPAIAAPAGTPVCLIEKVSAMREGGVVRASTCEDAGVIGP